MQTLAIGRRFSAFTLIELIVVVLLLGLVSNLVLQQMTGLDPQSLAKQSAERFIAAFKLANSEAILRQSAYGVTVESDHYIFSRYNELKNKWEPLLADKQLGMFMSHRQLDFNITPKQSPPLPDVIITSEGAKTAFTFQVITVDNQIINVSGGPSGYLTISQGLL